MPILSAKYPPPPSAPIHPPPRTRCNCNFLCYPVCVCVHVGGPVPVHECVLLSTSTSAPNHNIQFYERVQNHYCYRSMVVSLFFPSPSSSWLSQFIPLFFFVLTPSRRVCVCAVATMLARVCVFVSATHSVWFVWDGRTALLSCQQPYRFDLVLHSFKLDIRWTYSYTTCAMCLVKNHRQTIR